MVPKAFSLSIHGLEWLQELLVSLLAFELILADLSFFALRKILSKFVQIPGVPSIHMPSHFEGIGAYEVGLLCSTEFVAAC